VLEGKRFDNVAHKVERENRRRSPIATSHSAISATAQSVRQLSALLGSHLRLHLHARAHEIVPDLTVPRVALSEPGFHSLPSGS